jgi:hypothetical protein
LAKTVLPAPKKVIFGIVIAPCDRDWVFVDLKGRVYLGSKSGN